MSTTLANIEPTLDQPVVVGGVASHSICLVLLYIIIYESLGGHHSISGGGGGAGVFVAGKLFIPPGLGGAQKISHFITCLYRTVHEVNHLFHAESARKYSLKKKLQPPPPEK